MPNASSSIPRSLPKLNALPTTSQESNDESILRILVYNRQISSPSSPRGEKQGKEEAIMMLVAINARLVDAPQGPPCARVQRTVSCGCTPSLNTPLALSAADKINAEFLGHCQQCGIFKGWRLLELESGRSWELTHFWRRVLTLLQKNTLSVNSIRCKMNLWNVSKFVGSNKLFLFSIFFLLWLWHVTMDNKCRVFFETLVKK